MVREIVTSENKKQFIEKKLKLQPEHQQTLIHIPLEHIEHGESATSGGKLTFSGANDLIKKYASMKTDLPPIDVMSNDEDSKTPWMIADGSHRYEAAKLRKMTHIQAYVSKHDKEGLELAKKYKKAHKD